MKACDLMGRESAALCSEHRKIRQLRAHHAAGGVLDSAKQEVTNLMDNRSAEHATSIDVKAAGHRVDAIGEGGC